MKKSSWSFSKIAIFAFDILNIILCLSTIVLFVLKASGYLVYLKYTPIIAFIVAGLNFVAILITVLYLVFRKS
ncbi:MAG: hypothetical protein IJW82_01005 [Clostridia bacterium]|nr:hypothetical protein [Clostridia bacterium]